MNQSEVVIFSIELPPQGYICCQTGGVSLSQLHSEDRILSGAVSGCVCPEDCVDAPEEVAEHLLLFHGATLAVGDEVFQVDAYLLQSIPLQLCGGLRKLSINVWLRP